MAGLHLYVAGWRQPIFEICIIFSDIQILHAFTPYKEGLGISGDVFVDRMTPGTVGGQAEFFGRVGERDAKLCTLEDTS